MANFLSIQKDFNGVLSQSDDQAIVKVLLEQYVPDDVKKKIIIGYNRHACGFNKLKLEQENTRREKIEASIENVPYFKNTLHPIMKLRGVKIPRRRK